MRAVMPAKKKGRTCLVATTALLASGTVGGSAFAHHPATGGPTTESVELGPMDTPQDKWLRLGPFTQLGGAGDITYGTFGLRATALVEPMQFGLSLPFHSVREPGHDTELGPGDFDLLVAGRLLEAHGLTVLTGGSLRVPIGDEERGLGGGVFRLTPHVGAEWAPSEFRLRLVLADSIALGDGPAEEEHRLDPQSAHELSYELTSGYRPEQLFLGAAVGGTTVLAEAGRGDTFLHVGPRVSWFNHATALTLAPNFAVTELKRFDYRVELSAQYAF